MGGPLEKGDSELGNHHFKGQTVSFREDIYVEVFLEPPQTGKSTDICWLVVHLFPEATGDLGFLSTNDVDLIVGCLRLLWRLARTARWLNHVSNEKSFRCLGYIEDCTTQLCGDYNTPLYIIIQIPIAQPVQWNAICFFFVAHVKSTTRQNPLWTCVVTLPKTNIDPENRQ